MQIFTFLKDIPEWAQRIIRALFWIAVAAVLILVIVQAAPFSVKTLIAVIGGG